MQSLVNKFRTLAKKIIPSGVRPFVNKIYFGINSIYYKGGDKYCPCCDSKVKAFLPYATYDREPRPNAQCPICGCMERHRLVWFFLQHKTEMFSKPTKLLHFAPEEMIQKKLKQIKNIDYLSADLYAANAMQKVDILNMPFEDNTFDATICLHVVAHVENDFKAYSELYRVTKSGGWVVLQTIVDEKLEKTIEYSGIDTPQKRKETYGQEDWYRIFGNDFKNRIESVGFSVLKIDYAKELGENDMVRMGLNQEPIYFCKK
jgi:SAM-dependent methyltransferase